MEIRHTAKKDAEKTSWSQSATLEEILRLPTEEVLTRLGTSQSGLTSEEATNRLQTYGYNQLPQKKKRTGAREGSAEPCSIILILSPYTRLKQIYNKPHLRNQLKTRLVPTVKIKIEYLGHVRNLLDTKRQEEIEINENSTIQDLLNILSKKHGEPFKRAIYEPGSSDLKANFMATVNGHLLNQLKGVNTKLKNNDNVTIMPIVSGG